MKNLLYVIGIGVVFSLLFSSGQIENPDTHLRLTQTRIIIDHHEFGLPNDVGEDSHGNMAINKQGKRYMVYNPGHSLLFIPLYLLSEKLSSSPTNAYYLAAFVVSFFNFFIHVISTYLLYLICRQIGAAKQNALMTSLFFGLTSYSFTFANSTYEHHFEMLFVLLSLYLILNDNIRHKGIIVGLAISCGLLFRSTTLFALPGLIILLNSRKDIFQLLISSSIGIILLLIYNYLRFGSILETGYSLAWLLAHGDKVKHFWSVQEIPKAFFGFLFSPAKGLLFFSTTVFISFLFFKKFYFQNRRLFISIATTALIYLVVFSSNFAWHGSIWSFGPRYILPVLPLLYIPLINLKIKKWVFVVLAVGFISQILLTSVNYKRNVLECYSNDVNFNEASYLNQTSSIPQIAQFKQLIRIVPKNLNGELSNLQPNIYWVKEQRLGTNQDVLDKSIEKNSINFWWIRVLHWDLPTWMKVASILLATLAFVSGIILIGHVRKEL